MMNNKKSGESNIKDILLLTNLCYFRSSPFDPNLGPEFVYFRFQKTSH